jgi:alpha-L-fucosidase
MDKPKDEIVMKTLSTQIGALNSKIINIELLGSDEKIEWERNERGLVIKTPKSFPTDYAHAFKILLEGYTETDIGGTIEAHED